MICIGVLLAAAGCRAPQSTDPNDATRTEPDAYAPAGPSDAAAAVAGDPRMQCADATKELRFLETHARCTVDQDCALVDTWLYPCGMPIQKSAIPDLMAVDHSVSIACTKRGFHAPERDCTAAVLRSACTSGSCVNVVPVPLP